MAKKDAYQEFLNDLIAAVPEGQRATVEEAMKAEAVNSKLKEGVLARSDYSRSMDALRTEREALANEVTEARSRIDGWSQWYESATRDYAQMQQRVSELEAGGDPTGPVTLPPNVLTREQVTEELANRDRLAIAFADTLTDLKLDHRERFKEKLNTNELIQFATKRGLPLDAAYREFTADRVKEQQEADMEARLKTAREEGAREYATSHRLPIASTNMEPHVLDNTNKVPQNPRDRIQAAAAAWNSSTHTSS
jgi:hypothetical protein